MSLKNTACCRSQQDKGTKIPLKDEQKKWHVYLLQCHDNTLYCGITNNISRRVQQHNAGTAAKYTRGRGPVRLLTSVVFPDKSSALRAELLVKQQKKQHKETFLNNFISNNLHRADNKKRLPVE